LAQIPDARVRFASQSGGFGSGRDITVMLAGSNPDLLEETAATLVEQMKGIDLLVAPRPAERRVEPVMVERLLQPLRLPHIGVERAVIERIDTALLGLGVLPDEQFHACILRRLFAQLVHGAKFPGRVDMEKREGRRGGMEGFAGQVQHHCTVLADRVQHDGLGRLGDDFTQNMDAFGLKPVEMGSAGHDGWRGKVGPDATEETFRVARTSAR
jgi:hypothetical protein